MKSILTAVKAGINKKAPTIALALMLAMASSGAAFASEKNVKVDLIRQDFSDCVNSNVTPASGQIGGFVDVRPDEDQLVIKVHVQHGTPNTKYNIFLKCVRQIGTFTTNDRGVGHAEFRVPKNLVSSVFAFDMYPDGAPLGNKYQSVQVRLPH